MEVALTRPVVQHMQQAHDLYFIIMLPCRVEIWRVIPLADFGCHRFRPPPRHPNLSGHDWWIANKLTKSSKYLEEDRLMTFRNILNLIFTAPSCDVYQRFTWSCTPENRNLFEIVLGLCTSVLFLYWPVVKLYNSPQATSTGSPAPGPPQKSQKQKRHPLPWAAGLNVYNFYETSIVWCCEHRGGGHETRSCLSVIVSW